MTINLSFQLKNLDKLLETYKGYWQPTLLAGYPEPLEQLPQDWIDYYQQATIEDLYGLSVFKSNGKKLPKGLPDSLEKLVRDLYEVCDIPLVGNPESLMEEDDIYRRQILKLSAKKAHEFSVLGPYVLDTIKKHRIDNFVDVGGGKGFLSLSVSSCTCRQILIDQNEGLLRRGEGYFRRWKRAKELESHKVFIETPAFLDNCKLSGRTLTGGLHLCGDLSVHQIKASVVNESVSLVNVGCCYHRISESNLNLSGLCTHHLRPTDLRLALSPFAYRFMDTFLNNQIKNHYRYALYSLYQYFFHKVPTKSFLNEVAYPVKETNLDFFEFIENNRSKFEMFDSLDEVKRVYEAEIASMACAMETYEFFRRLFSRALEVYIILDRVGYLNSNGLEAEVFQFFDGRVSPRNIGIVACRTA